MKKDIKVTVWYTFLNDDNEEQRERDSLNINGAALFADISDIDEDNYFTMLDDDSADKVFDFIEKPYYDEEFPAIDHTVHFELR